MTCQSLWNKIPYIRFMNKPRRLSKAQIAKGDQQPRTRVLDPALLSLSQAERARLVWRHLADYANSDLAAGEKGFEALDEALAALMLGIRGSKVNLRLSANVSLQSEAKRNQANLRKLFAWLCKPKTNSDLRLPALRFLESNAHDERWHIDFDEDWTDLQFDEQEGPDSYFVKVAEYTPMALVCKFIFDQVDPPPAEGLPIRICKRSGCGKFYVRERSRKQYCSDSCRAADHQSKSERRDYQYVRRLEQTDDLGLLHVKLRSPVVQSRLAVIGAQWPEWAIEKIKRIKER